LATKVGQSEFLTVICHMIRRHFFLQSLAATTASLLPMSMTTSEKRTRLPKLLMPSPLQQGDTVALIAPSSPPAETKFTAAYEHLELLGLKVQAGQHMRAQTGYLAGTDEQRAADIMAAFLDPAIKGIWCVRGGYGCARLLNLLDYKAIRRHPKPLIGYSDITALHIALLQRAGLMSFHGQVAGGDFTDFTQEHLKKNLFQTTSPYPIEPYSNDILLGGSFVPKVIAGGSATGPLTGGNLSILASLVGTSFQPIFAKKIVFIEEIGEAPYRLDRLLTQLLQSTDLRKAAGIALGVFNDCEQKGTSPTWTMIEVLTERLGSLGIPVVYGLPFGHISNQCVLPMGQMARLDAEALRLSWV
jgi:muramoyltetrapeptide carboxypeptidase